MKTISILILDSSYSMQGLKSEITCPGGALDSFVRDTRKFARDKDQVFVTDFNSEVSHKVVGVHPYDVETIPYELNGLTALYDAVGSTLDLVIKSVKDTKKTRYLVTIISDGYENSSRKYSGVQIANKIKELTATDRWTFTCVGAKDIDLESIFETWNIPSNNILSFKPTVKSIRQVTDTLSQVRSQYYGSKTFASAEVFSNNNTIKEV